MELLVDDKEDDDERQPNQESEKHVACCMGLRLKSKFIVIEVA